MAELARNLVVTLAIGCSACAEPPDEVPPPAFVCNTTVEGCECGGVGCPCADGGGCKEGTCNEHSGTCVKIVDEMVYVPQGSFWMGSQEGLDTDEITGPCDVDETPYRQVTIDAYWFDQFEVRKGDYRGCMDAGVCSQPYLWDLEDEDGPVGDSTSVPGLDTFPAASISWSQAAAYCEWVGKRLPSEAEWEKAARGTDGRKYPWGNENPICDNANYATSVGECPNLDEHRTLTPVGSFPAGTSVYGALDMAGNVKEWTNDAMEYGIGYESLPTENPKGIESENGRAFRGGGYQSPILAAGGYVLRTSLRGRGQISWTALTRDHGFRCAKDPD